MARALRDDVRVDPLNCRSMWMAVPRLIRHLKATRPDVVLCAGVQDNVIALWARFLMGRGPRLIVSVHSNMTHYSRNAMVWYARFNPLAMRLFYRFADGYIAVSTDVLHDLAQLVPSAVPRGKVIYNPVVDDGLLIKAEEEVDHPWFEEHADVPVVLSVGRLDPFKDHDLLIAAFEKVRARRPAQLVVIGDGRERMRLDQLVAASPYSSSIQLLGFESNPYKYMSRASVLVLSSRFEGLGNVLVEALACGCPVVSTDCPSGPREILEDGKWGRLVPVGDRDRLAEAISETLDELPDKERLRRRAMDFTVKQSADEYLSMLLN